MSTPQDKEQDQQQLRNELERLRGTDLVIDIMLKLNIPLDRETYIGLAYLGMHFGPDPISLTAEEEEALPEPFRREGFRGEE